MADSTNAQIGSLVTLDYWAVVESPPAYSPLGKVRSIAGVGVNAPEVESTTLDSTGVDRIAGLEDGKQVTIVLTTTAASLAVAEANHKLPMDLRLLIPAPTSRTRYFTIILLDYDLGTITASGLMELTLQGRITGGRPTPQDPHGTSPE
jgi:hypothetical protein